MGLGRLFPNARNIHDLILLQKVPELLHRCGSARQQLETLVDLWSLCDAIDERNRIIAELQAKAAANRSSYE